jgi:hypothetical protein
VEAFNSLIEDKNEILNSYDDLTKKITDFSKEEKEIKKIELESQLLQTALEKLISENARTTINQTDYANKCNNLAEKHTTPFKKGCRRS